MSEGRTDARAGALPLWNLSVVFDDNVTGLCRVLTVLRRHGVQVDLADFVQGMPGVPHGVLTLQASQFASSPELVVRHLEKLVGVIAVGCVQGTKLHKPKAPGPQDG